VLGPRNRGHLAAASEPGQLDSYAFSRRPTTCSARPARSRAVGFVRADKPPPDRLPPDEPGPACRPPTTRSRRHGGPLGKRPSSVATAGARRPTVSTGFSRQGLLDEEHDMRDLHSPLTRPAAHALCPPAWSAAIAVAWPDRRSHRGTRRRPTHRPSSRLTAAPSSPPTHEVSLGGPPASRPALA